MFLGLLAVVFVAVGESVLVPHAAPGLLEGFAGVAASLSRAKGEERVAVGWNANLDVVVDAGILFAALDLPAGAAPRDHATIETAQEFASVFSYWFAQGKAAERFVRNTTLFQMLADAGLETGRLAPGGNAALMAAGMAASVDHVLLGGIVREKLKALLPDNVVSVSPWEVHDDQVHLIIEYARGTTLRGVTADRANRFIVSNDVLNARQVAADPFLIRTQSFNPTVVILSGAHLLDGVPERSERRKILRSVRSRLEETRKKLGPSVPFHFEWASVGESTVVDDVLLFMKQNVDSMGFNEEEARSLYASLGLSEIAGSEFCHSPKPAIIAKVLADMLSRLPAQLQRLHFHSLGLHMIAHRGETWTDEVDAVLAGALKTSLRVCNVSSLKGNEDLFEFITAPTFEHPSLNQRVHFTPGATWTEPGSQKAGESVHIAACPVLVCKKPVQTVGAGDSISSSALLRSMRGFANRARN